MDELDLSDLELPRLPTGRSEMRLVKEKFQKIHDSAGRIRETFFNLQGAFHMSSNPDRFALDWMKKDYFLNCIQQKLSEVESMISVATGGIGASLPVVSNLETVRALNKTKKNAQLERRPVDIRRKRKKRKRDYDRAHTKLHAVQTPLVEAHRPNKKRISEASRHQKNFKAKAKKTGVPKTLHPSVKSDS